MDLSRSRHPNRFTPGSDRVKIKDFQKQERKTRSHCVQCQVRFVWTGFQEKKRTWTTEVHKTASEKTVRLLEPGRLDRQDPCGDQNHVWRRPAGTPQTHCQARWWRSDGSGLFRTCPWLSGHVTGDDPKQIRLDFPGINENVVSSGTPFIQITMTLKLPLLLTLIHQDGSLSLSIYAMLSETFSFVVCCYAETIPGGLFISQWIRLPNNGGDWADVSEDWCLLESDAHTPSHDCSLSLYLYLTNFTWMKKRNMTKHCVKVKLALWGLEVTLGSAALGLWLGSSHGLHVQSSALSPMLVPVKPAISMFGLRYSVKSRCNSLFLCHFCTDYCWWGYDPFVHKCKLNSFPFQSYPSRVI